MDKEKLNSILDDKSQDREKGVGDLGEEQDQGPDADENTEEPLSMDMAINKAAELLPEGYRLYIQIEKGGYNVSLEAPVDSPVSDVDRVDSGDGMISDVIEAIIIANARQSLDAGNSSVPDDFTGVVEGGNIVDNDKVIESESTDKTEEIGDPDPSGDSGEVDKQEPVT